MSEQINRNKAVTHIPCADLFNRRRSVGVLAELATDRVLLAAPPGEAAWLTAHEARLLAQQLLTNAAVLDVEHDRSTQFNQMRPTG